MKIWPFPLIRDYATSESISKLFIAYADSGPMIDRVDLNHLSLTSPMGKLRFWSSNADYAWAMDGVFTSSNGERLEWMSVMPSRYAVRKMRKKIEALQNAVIQRAIEHVA